MGRGNGAIVGWLFRTGDNFRHSCQAPRLWCRGGWAKQIALTVPNIAVGASPLGRLNYREKKTLTHYPHPAGGQVSINFEP